MRARRPTKPVRPDLQPGRLLLSQAQIHTRVRQLGRTITRHYAGQAPLFLGIMNGALFFLADLLRTVDLDSEVTCVRLASYHTGATLIGVRARLKELGAADVKVCVLLQKKKPGQKAVPVDWIGFKIPDHFVIGYGLDYNGRYRGLKQIRVLETPAV
jgi:hypoxanthine phosphoribosyltransferase